MAAASTASICTAGPPLSSRTMASRFDIGRPASCLAIAEMVCCLVFMLCCFLIFSPVSLFSYDDMMTLTHFLLFDVCVCVCFNSKQPTGSRCGDAGVIFAVGGRSILKVLRVGRDGITEVCAQLNPNAQTQNMKKRTGAPQSSTFDICELSWSGQVAGVYTLAAGTKNGVVCLWDVRLPHSLTSHVCIDGLFLCMCSNFPVDENYLKLTFIIKI
jgi:hypothetical protein